MKMLDSPRLAFGPARVVGRGTVERGMEQHAAEDTNVDDDDRIARQRHLAQLRAEAPRFVGVELRERERAFLMRDGLQIVSDVHERVPP